MNNEVSTITNQFGEEIELQVVPTEKSENDEVITIDLNTLSEKDRTMIIDLNNKYGGYIFI